MFSEMKKEIIEAGILLDRYELVSLTCGNLSVRMRPARFSLRRPA
nr:hypothetical protein [Butyricicoccus sp. OF13-6]